jgi:hypothetical protein
VKATDLIDALERFFLDIIGTVLPGAAFIFGCCYVTKTTPLIIGGELTGSKDYISTFLIFASYIMGYAVISFAFQVVVPAMETVASWKLIAPLLPFVMGEKKISKDLANDPIFLAFQSAVSMRLPSIRNVATQNTPLRVWRALAIGIVQKDSPLIYRFTFISLLNIGVATSLILTVLVWLSLAASRIYIAAITVRELNVGLPLALLAALLFIERYYQFNRRTLQIPFSMALIRLEVDSDTSNTRKNADVSVATTISRNVPISVYLAGGFRSGWQDTVRARVPSVRYVDPRLHGLLRSDEYTTWDLEAIRRSDCVFAYLEGANPGGYALALEVGFAKALGKCVILVDEKSCRSDSLARRLGMVRECSDVVFNTLTEGIQFLEKYRSIV